MYTHIHGNPLQLVIKGLIAKPDKNTSWQEKYTPIALMTVDVKSLKKISKSNSKIYKTIDHDQVRFIKRDYIGLVFEYQST